MAEIYNINDAKREKEIEEAMSGLTYIFEMPDDVFKIVYPTMKEEFIKSMKNGEFEETFFQNGISKQEKEEYLETLKELKEKGRESLSCQEKIDFLKLILNSIEDTLNDINYRDTVTVAIELCHPNAKEPTYANPDDAGCDVYAVETTHIAPGATAIVKTGLKVAVPAGWMLSVRPRSGMSAKTGIRIANAPGTIKVVK